MARFLVERYWPGVTPGDVEVATGELRARGLGIVETILAAPDEVCLWYVEAINAEIVATAFAAAAVPFDRLTAATRIAGCPEQGPRYSRPATSRATRSRTSG